MELLRDICSGEGCGRLLPIVNRRYYLCDDCNFKRTHHGKTKQQVYTERSQAKQQVNVEKSKPGSDTIRPIRSKLKKVSNAQRYRCSDGTLVSQAEIHLYLKLTYAKIDETRLPFCEGSGKTGVPLSHSHTISQARCKELGKTELIWDEDNIFLEEFEAPTSNPTAAHNIWEVSSIEKKITLVNFDKKLEYIAIHDPEQYRKFTMDLEWLAHQLKEDYEQ